MVQWLSLQTVRISRAGLRLAPYGILHFLMVLPFVTYFGPGDRWVWIAYCASYPLLLGIHLFARARFGYRIWTTAP